MPKKLQIRASAGAGGSITPSGNVMVDNGADQSFSITPDTGYHIVDVLVDGVSVGAIGSYPFTNVVANHTIDASFALNTYTITASAGAGGSITPSGNVMVDHGADQSFSITPDTGYHIVDVLVDGVSVGAVGSYTFTGVVTSTHRMYAYFAINTYKITASAGAGGSITPSGNVMVNHGANQSFSITPNAGYHLLDVLVDGVSVGAVDSYLFTSVVANHTIEASFAPNTCTIAASARAGGSVAPSGQVVVSYGEDQVFSITPDAGYHVLDVLVDGVSVGAVDSYPFTGVVANHTIEASFAINTYTIMPSAGAGGSITPSGQVVVDHGANQTFNILQNAQFGIADVVVDGDSIGPVSSYTFVNVVENHRIEATFTYEGPYIANRRSKEIHKSDCYWVTQMAPSNKQPCTSLSELRDLINLAGYNGCYYCLPEYDTDRLKYEERPEPEPLPWDEYPDQPW